jgi:membrane-associated phospholipid phosphatase
MIAVDLAVAAYVIFVALVAIVYAAAVPAWPYILSTHAILVVFILALPPRGAAWERPQPGDSTSFARLQVVARFLRYTYPALLLTPFFEEVALTVNAASPGSRYWFEHILYAADLTLFGATPSVALSQAGNPVLDELMHAFYFAYFPLIIGGIFFAWSGGRRGGDTPAPGFQTAFTCMMLGFLLSYVWYPFLPARGPWENASVMAGLRPFQGWLFTDAIHLIIGNAAVSGGCFPSAHVSGTWALTFGLHADHPKAARWFGVVAAGLSVSCVYTRYHHGVDVLAGLAVAAIAAVVGYRLTRGAPSRKLVAAAAHGRTTAQTGA